MQKMLDAMARMYTLFILMGVMIVAIAFVIGYFNSLTATAYYAAPKAVRETQLLAERAAIESTGLWLPYFKFLGIGFILAGIVMALRIIINRLRAAGVEVLNNLPPEQRPELPEPPWYGLLAPWVMMLGLVIFIVALVVGVQNAQAATALFSNPIPAIDAAGAGTGLLATLQSIKATSAWLVPFKFFGISTMFLSIAMGLGVIVFLLTQQTQLLDGSLETAKKGAKAPASRTDSNSEPVTA